MRKKFSVDDLEKMRKRSTATEYYTKLMYLLGRGIGIPLPIVVRAFKEAVAEAKGEE